MKISHLLSVAAAVGLTVPALAQIAAKAETRAEAEAKIRERFGALDANKDSFVTRDEIDAQVEKMESAKRADTFDAIDTDHNGSISRAEFASHHDAETKMIVMRTRESDAPGADAKPPKPMRMMMLRKDRGGGMIANAMDDKGRISIDAVVKAALVLFDAADADHNGVLTPDERKAAREARKAGTAAK
jgi:hypothetical protein